MKIGNKKELKTIAEEKSGHLDYKDFLKIYNCCTRKPYSFMTIDDNNALDKARFEFSPLGQTFSIGLDKTAQGYQKEGVMKLLKDIRDGLRGGVRPPGPDNNDDNNADKMMMIMIKMMIIIIMIMMMIIMMMVFLI